MSSRGAILLPMIVIMSIILLTIGIAGMTVGVAVSRANSSMRFSEKALFGAQAGIDDVKRRIIRNSQWSPLCPPSYTLSFGTASVDVCVAKSGNQYTAQAIGSSQNARRRIDAILEVHPLTGQMRTVSSYEVQF